MWKRFRHVRVLILTAVLALTGTAVAYGIARSGSGSDGEGFPDPVPPAPALKHDYRGEPIILESGSPPAEVEEKGPAQEMDGLLSPKNFEENSRRAVTPNTDGDDAESCVTASTAKDRLDRREVSRPEFESEIAKAKGEAASPAMRDALDGVLAGGEVPPCPPVGRP